MTKKITLSFVLFGLIYFLTSVLYSQTLDPNTVDGNIYVKFNDFTDVYQDESGKYHIDGLPEVENVLSKYQIERAYNSFKGSPSELLMKTYRIVLTDMNKSASLIQELNRLQEVDYAEPVPLFRTTYTPNDLGNQSGSPNQWGLYQIDAQDAWDITLGDPTVLVAIVDDAVDIDHEDLNPVIWTNTAEIPNNGIDDDGNGRVDDVNGYDVANNDNDPRPDNSQMTHGTHVAGISGAATDNNKGVASIGAGVTILPVKATYSAGFVTDGYEGITYAANNGAHVINCSWGGSSSSSTGQNVITTAYNQGSIIVAAAGNNNVSSPFYPAAFTNVISVASTTTGDIKSSFSNYGSTVDISAPGSSIYATVPNNGYSNKSGTSMASPMVAGLVGLIYSVDPTLSKTDVENCLLNTADDIDPVNPSYAGQLGSGRINAEQALICAQGLSNPLPIDVGTQLITAPNTSYTSCSPLPVTVTATFRNFGINTQSGIPVNFELDTNGTVIQSVSETLNQSLVQGSTNSYTFSQQLTLPGPGVYTLKVFTSLSGDGNAANDMKQITITVSGSQTIFTEDFESGSFATNGWTTNNPDNNNGWSINSVSGASSGSQAAEMDMFYYSTGERDQLISQSFDFSNNSALELMLEYAHRRRDQTVADSLIIKVSTDGGATYPNVVFAEAENGSGNFGTGAITNNVQFNPSSPSDWCYAGGVGASCLSIDLSAFDGQPNVKIMFETYSGSGNNLYLDNLEISGGCATSGGSQLPSSDFYANQTTVCSGEQVSFTNSASNATSYSWVFTGGTPGTSTQANPIITYAQPGTYMVQLTASNSAGSDVETKNGYITVHQSPSSGFNYNNVGSLQVNFTDQSNGATNLSWDFGDGNSSNNSNPSHTYSAAGTYNVCLIAGNQNCPADTVCQSVVVTTTSQGPAPTAQMSLSSNAVCQGDVINFFDQSANNPTSWQWSFQGGTPASSTSQNPNITYYTPGTYDVTLVAANANGSDTLTQTGVITVYAVPVANFNHTASGLIVSFSDLSTGATSWNWNFGDGNTSSSQNPQHTYASAGTYQVCLVSDNAGCPSDSKCINVTVTSPTGGQAPQANYSVSTSNVCAGSAIQFFDQSTNSPVTWSWTFQGGTPATSTNQNPTVTYSAAGTYDVTLISSNSSGSDTIYQNAVINVYDQPVAAFNYFASGLTVNFQNASSGSTSWTWGFGDGSFSSSASPSYTYSAPGTYQVCLTADNPACSDDLKCDSITIDSTSSSTSIADLDRGVENLLIYPNPTEDVLNIQFDNVNRENVTIRLVDLLGKTHYNFKSNSTNIEFNHQLFVTEYATGTYVLFVNGSP
ncbi:MAG: PKD domain-containing protein, partial [Flavobacteriales bacterium]|nr:PKD domain-containing protein [Flavobacteriales bacterium]